LCTAPDVGLGFAEREIMAKRRLELAQLAHEAQERFVKILPALSPAILPE